jgi:hypothetical protein
VAEPAEFDCINCGRHIINIGMPVSEPQLCMTCIWLPGWFNDPELRHRLDPDFDPSGRTGTG